MHRPQWADKPVTSAKIWLPFFLLWLFAPVLLHAQSDRPQWWFAYNQSARLSDRWGYGFDLNHRSNGVLPVNSTLTAARIGANYHTNTGFRITAGYAWFGTFVPDLERIWLHENRIYEQVQYQHGEGKINFVHRVRIEHRFRRLITDIDQNEIDVFTTNRYRYLFQLDGPIPRAPERNTALRWQLANEFFIHNKEEVGFTVFDQNRTLAGVLISPQGSLSLAVLYQLIIQQQPLLREYQTIHSFRVTLFHQLDFRRKATMPDDDIQVID
jgi:hypothetical protein